MLQPVRLQRFGRGSQPFAKLGLHTVELARVGPLEGIDRLLLVADDKDRPPHVGARADPTGKFLRQPRDDLPLHRAGILRLVQQDMVDSTIEPKQHPGRHVPAGQKVDRLQDQIIKVEPAAPLLGLCIGGQHDLGEIVQGPRGTQRTQRQPRFARGFDPEHPGFERGHCIAQRALGGLGGETADLGRKWRLGLGPGQKHGLQKRQRRKVQHADRAELVGVLLVRARPSPKRGQ